MCETSLCRISREACSTLGEHKTKNACIFEVDESMRIRMERAPRRYLEDHIAGKDMNSLSRCSSGKMMWETWENVCIAIDESQWKDCDKLKGDDHEPVFNYLDKFLIREPSDCVEKPGILKASTGKPDTRARRNSKPDAASSSEGRLKDAYLDGLICRLRYKSGIMGVFWIWILKRSRQKSIRKTWWGCTKARSKCTKNTSLSLRTRNLDVKFFSRSRSYRETSYIQKFKKFREFCGGKQKNGHIIFMCLQQFHLTWRESIPSYDKCSAEVRRMTWMTSTWTHPHGVYFWMSHSKLQFILVKTIWRI